MPFANLASDPANTTGFDTAPVRRRPLVTYGKRKPAPRETTPPPKKRRLETSAERDPSPVDGTCIVDAASPTPPPPPTSPPKTSILRYFKKVASPTSASERSFTAASASQTPDSSPAASPKIASPESRPRSRRRLTTRPFAGLNAVSAHENVPSRHDHAPGPLEHNTDPPGESSLQSITSNSGTLRDVSASKTKPACNCSDKLCRHTRRTRSKRPGYKSPTAAVQMTLNLSTRDAGIKQCRECDMLYNPLHPSDVKHHARHHASVVKMKASAG